MTSKTAGKRDAVLLGTVAIEPNRWSRDGAAPVAVSAWLDAISGAGFDGLELWERHLTLADEAEVEHVLGHDLPVAVFNSYVSMDEPDRGGRAAVADWVRRTGAEGVKFNVGNDSEFEGRYAERISEWLDVMPEGVTLWCECHHGISIAEDPVVAARIFDAVGSDRVGAIVHTHESPEHLRARFDAYGDRIGHVHVNFLRFDDGVTAPALAEITDQLAAQVSLLRSLGFTGSWTIEFVAGVSTDRDVPELLVAQAIDDLAVLRSVIA